MPESPESSTDDAALTIADLSDAAQRRDDVLTRVRDHAGRIARELAAFRGGDYGEATFDTDAGQWTLKYEAGDVRYLRFEPTSGSEVYVVSAHEPPAPDELATALADYDAFVEAYNRWVDSVDGALDDVSTSFPSVASTADLVADRDRVLDRVREVADAMAGELHRSDGEYGTFSTTVSGTRWELKWEADRASYLRVGGADGTYLLSQYEQPSAAEVRRLAGEFSDFVEAFNDHVRDLECDLSAVTLSGERESDG